LATDDLDTPGAQEDATYQEAALQIARRSQQPQILKRLKPDPERDDLRELMAVAASLITTPETVAYQHRTVPASRLGTSLAALRFLLTKGARWTPDQRTIPHVRRALHRVDAEAISTVVDLLRTHRACDEAVLKALVRTEKMRRMLAAVNQRRASGQPPAKGPSQRRRRAHPVA
jgi:hypothetical protein